MEKPSQIERIKNLLDDGYTKSELARKLEISRSTLIHLLEDPDYSPSKAIQGRINVNLDWLEKSHGHELLEALTLMFFPHEDAIKNFRHLVNKTEDATGFEIGYHGMTIGGPAAFMIINSPGSSPMTDVLAKNPFPYEGFGRTESFLIGEQSRYSCEHENAVQFFEENPESKIYLNIGTSYNFSSLEDLANVQKLITQKFPDSIFLMELGPLAGRYDFFILIAAKDEETYFKFLSDQNAISTILSKAATETITYPVFGSIIEPKSKQLTSYIKTSL